jgi:hypothetical protein
VVAGRAFDMGGDLALALVAGGAVRDGSNVMIDPPGEDGVCSTPPGTTNTSPGRRPMVGSLPPSRSAMPARAGRQITTTGAISLPSHSKISLRPRFSRPRRLRASSGYGNTGNRHA